MTDAPTTVAVDHDAIWRILAEECGADPEMPYSFLMQWPECREYRFMGSLGFGGKVYAGSFNEVYVGYYRENRTPERQAAVDAANARLASFTWRAATGEER